jgi:AcrR family transcriptional regulator
VPKQAPSKTPRTGRNGGKRRDLVAHEILESAAALFAERGFAATSLQEVANALGLSRTALYHYIGSKDDLLNQLVKEMPSQTADALHAIRTREDLTPLERITEAITDMTHRSAANPARFRLLVMSSNHLTPELRSRFREARVAVLEHLSAMIKEAVHAGDIRPVDPDLAAFAILGMCNWVAWWYRGHESGRSVDEVARAFREFAVSGLQADPSHRELSTQSGIDHAMALLRADLDYLERSLKERQPSARPASPRARAGR